MFSLHIDKIYRYFTESHAEQVGVEVVIGVFVHFDGSKSVWIIVDVRERSVQIHLVEWFC